MTPGFRAPAGTLFFRTQAGPLPRARLLISWLGSERDDIGFKNGFKQEKGVFPGNLDSGSC